VLANCYFRYKPAYLENYPIPSPTPQQEKVVSGLARLALLAYSENTGDQDALISFLENVIDACVFELYFHEHMRDKDLLFHGEVIPLIQNYDPEASEQAQKAFVEQFYKAANAPDHPIRNRLLRLTADSPDLLAVIKDNGTV